ncbi:group II intron maturase-specific domain-containing protein [Thalassoroseus pseudoceratinae]|uniref:group II intron maturase-specific domain-containing protein n=1 Tax=Thalassoroseus pseudoceratinae TaxID=2713176 RepID=UPI00141E50F5|nr:group II intron maturase-specific domain-containing protein [Thalassoroseus pseudoceratinae]
MGRKPANACVRTGLISPPIPFSPKLRGYEQKRHTRPVRVRATVNVAAKSLHKFKQRIRAITGRSRGISMERRLSELRSYVRGWMGYFGLASQLKLFDKLDQWIRRRIRMCYWKQWRRPKRRREMLIRLGVPRRQAIRHARSRRSYWHMSKTIASGVGLTNAWLAEQGLLSLKTLWAKLAQLR